MAVKEIERRVYDATELRVQRESDGPPRIIGHAAVFNAPSVELYGFTEEVARGAFRESVQTDDIRALFNHDPNYVLGRNTAGTLKVREDRTGLAVDIEPPDVQWANDLLVSIERGDISGMSFGFRTLDDEWSVKDEKQIRRLKKVALMDVSPVTYPAYPDTDVAVRSLKQWLSSQQPDLTWVADAERRLRLREVMGV